MEEHLLVKRCLKGKASAQHLLYERFKGRLFGLCLRYADSEEEALDLLQEGFIKIFRDLHQFRGDGPLEAWMRRVVVNSAISRLRKRKWIRETDFDWDQLPDQEKEVFQDRMDAEELILLIQRLPKGFRTVFNLYAVEGYSHQEIAQFLGIAESTSRSQYQRARKTLQEWIRKQEVSE
ncbi:MAG: sigma-70 family RNA polymerase sigma factor [Saprospiraceae bacterium]|nr:sigma-70 family RNA polymerase sigma factor [Lewinella sp.]